jgi:pimeloyl-ACP methyl ester carboxylesterase
MISLPSRMRPRTPSRRSRSDVAIDVDKPQAPRAVDDARAEVSAPGALLLALEGRAPWEFAASLVATPWLRKLPMGDGHRVLVLPGLAANDLTTLPMRAFLKDRGYQTSPWEQGLNLGPRAGVLDALRARVRELFEIERQKISLVGWSLGGVYAREMAKEMPELIRCVITLGSPFAGPPQATNAWWLFERVSGHPHPDAAMQAALRVAPPVPTTSIYSRTDGIVAWQCSLNPPGPLAENIQVPASHIGLGLNPLAMMAIADRLAQDPKRWQRFDTNGVRRFFFKTGC